jgi:hypothetical protein
MLNDMGNDNDLIDALALVEAGWDPNNTKITVEDAVIAVEAITVELAQLRAETTVEAEEQFSVRAMPIRYAGATPNTEALAALATMSREDGLALLPDVLVQVHGAFGAKFDKDGNPTLRDHFGPPVPASAMTGTILEGRGPCNKVAWINANNPYFEVKLIQEFDPAGIWWWVQIRDRFTGAIVGETRDELLGNPEWTLRGAMECEACVDNVLTFLLAWTGALIS